MTASPAPVQEQNPEYYIILPRKDSPDILVSETRTDQGLDWYKTHEVLNKEGYFMPTPRQFFDFLDLLRSSKRLYDGTGKKLSTVESDESKAIILDDILTQRERWRAEHLDAYFFVYDETMFVAYNHRTIHGKLRAIRTEPLEECVMQNCYVNLTGINKQGLPTRKSNTQTHRQGKNIYFFPPYNNSVAGFRADSIKVDFYCNWNPLDSVGGLKVRRQKFLDK